MAFSAESILMSLFAALVAALGSYFASYSKVKGELRAAREDLERSITGQIASTMAHETAKLEVATKGALEADARKCIYALVSAVQGLVHSMCWLSWDAGQRKQVRRALSESYDLESHKLQPEIMAQQALLMRLDRRLHERARPSIEKLFRLDVRFGEAIVCSESDEAAALKLLGILFIESQGLKEELDAAFLGQPTGSDAQQVVPKDM